MFFSIWLFTLEEYCKSFKTQYLQVIRSKNVSKCSYIFFVCTTLTLFRRFFYIFQSYVTLLLQIHYFYHISSKPVISCYIELISFQDPTMLCKCVILPLRKHTSYWSLINFVNPLMTMLRYLWLWFIKNEWNLSKSNHL